LVQQHGLVAEVELAHTLVPVVHPTELAVLLVQETTQHEVVGITLTVIIILSPATRLTVIPITVTHFAVKVLTKMVTAKMVRFVTTPVIKPVIKPVMPTIATITQAVAVVELMLLVPAQPLKIVLHTTAVQVAQVVEPTVFVAVTAVEDEEHKALGQMVQFQQVAVQS
jgi:hypothetical protein